MADNKNTPQGLISDQTFSASPDNGKVRMYKIAANTTNALFVGDPVVKAAGTASNAGVAAVTLASAGATANVGNAVTGVIVGFTGTAAAGTATVSPTLYGAPAGAYFRPATTALDYYALVMTDPNAEFVAQVTGNAVLGAAAIGKNVNLVAGAGSAATGLSGWTLDSTASTNALQVSIVDSVLGSDPNLPYAKFHVRLNSSTETKGSAGI